jgi:DNA-binding XRE family transcriptional regulator
MKVKFAITPDGEMAIIPRAEYERLKARADELDEDDGTARLVARAKKEVAAGLPLLPKATVDRLASGESPVRVLREFRNHTQAQLAAEIEVAQGYLSDLENGKRKGPFELHQRIAGALKLPLDLLAPTARPDSPKARKVRSMQKRSRRRA